MSDEIFDPEIHATDRNGNPSLNKDGSFRKKRKDAGGRPSPSRKTSTTARASAANPREKYHKSVSDVLQVGVTLASLADPVMGYAGSLVAPLWADVLADLAVEQPRLAAALERAGGLGAAGAVVAAGVLTFAQFGNLAGKVPDHMVRMVGGKTRAEIEQILKQRGAQLASEAEERARQDAEEAATAAEIAERRRAEREHGYAPAV